MVEIRIEESQFQRDFLGGAANVIPSSSELVSRVMVSNFRPFIATCSQWLTSSTAAAPSPGLNPSGVEGGGGGEATERPAAFPRPTGLKAPGWRRRWPRGTGPSETAWTSALVNTHGEGGVPRCPSTSGRAVGNAGGGESLGLRGVGVSPAIGRRSPGGVASLARVGDEDGGDGGGGLRAENGEAGGGRLRGCRRRGVWVPRESVSMWNLGPEGEASRPGPISTISISSACPLWRRRRRRRPLRSISGSQTFAMHTRM